MGMNPQNAFNADDFCEIFTQKLSAFLFLRLRRVVC